MNEQDFFDLMSGMSERQIGEAAEWKYKHPAEQDSSSEINAILSQNPPLNPLADTKKTEPQSAAETEAVPQTPPVQSKPQSRFIRHSAVGVAVVAAAFALAIGGLAWKLRSDNPEVSDMTPGISITSTSEAVTSAPAGESLPAAESSTTVPAIGETLPVAVDPDAHSIDQTVTEPDMLTQADDSVQAGEQNFLGGTGPLRTIVNEDFYTILEDDMFWYFNGTMRISKAQRDEHGVAVSELLCQNAGCAHNDPETCLVARCSNANLFGTGDKIFQLKQTVEHNADQFTFSRLFSDGSEHDMCAFMIDRDENDAGSYTYYRSAAVMPELSAVFAELEQCRTLENGSTQSQPIQALMRLSGSDVSYLQLELNLPRERMIGVPVMQSDPESGLIWFLTDSSIMHEKNYSYYYHAKIVTVDPKTGEVVTRLENADILDWFVADGKLYYLEPDDNKLTSRFCRFDPDNGSEFASSNLVSFSCCAGTVYAVRQVSVGKDSVIRFPLGTDLSAEETVTETNNLLASVAEVTDPNRILYFSDSGVAYLHIDGQGDIQLP